MPDTGLGQDFPVLLDHGNVGEQRGMQSLARKAGSTQGKWNTCRKVFSVASLSFCIAAKFAPSRRLMKSGLGVCSGRTLMARCSIQALLRPGE